MYNIILKICLIITIVHSFFKKICMYMKGFLGSPAGEESACNAGDPGFIPGLGSYPGEGTGYPFQYTWASMVA